ncbi:PHP domain-containing protein [Methanobacterium sp. MB1]|mgnify:CR=1 FL=1|jgi:predicted metal-dependent phosphoesterase TrpH|uniref:PHP domain-containing protein n=1 Tax=Methanobacterium sp. TaxID=2164 RepID=UPI0003C99CE8|nr:PHP domain-containing protein [uncultured Methanobacterium sp.]CDG65540.1 PHP domain-containing protein [Methanobacterium sp. MB1]
MRYDLHIHSKYSVDGLIEPKIIVKTAINQGLSGIAVTDHNTIRGALETKKFAPEDLEVIVGSEIGTEQGEVIGLFLSEEIVSRRLVEVVDEIREQDGLVVLPHPFDHLRGSGIQPGEEDAKLADCIETFNSRCLHDSYNEKAKIYAEKYSLPCSAGSDAHFTREIGNASVNFSSGNLRKDLLKGNYTIHGRKSSFINLGLTEIVKTWRKTVSR